MQLISYKQLLGMDDALNQANNGESKKDANLEQDPLTNRQMEDESNYPPLKTVVLSMLAIYLAFFLSALDRTIIGVAIPAITNDFKSFDDISWYESAFLLANCVLQFPLGKIYTFYSAKWTFVTLVFIFEIGSIVCAAAPSSLAFIVGRAIAGIGSAGSLVGASVIMIDLVPLRKRPAYQGLLGAIFGLASILGPLIGGILTTKVSWRWCFWINVPIGCTALVVLLIVLPASKPPEEVQRTLRQKVWAFDPIGNLVLAPGLICLLLALQWGGAKYRWSDPKLIALLTIGCVLLVLFIAVQFFQENGTIPPRIMRQRSIVAGVIVNLGLGATLIIPTFYLPIWFQAIKGTTAVAAGIRLLPLFLGTVTAVIGTGIAISKLGYYTPWLIVGCMIRVVAGGLLTTLKVESRTGEWIGYQLFIGIGTGMTLQQPFMAAQTVLAKKDVPLGLTILAFAQFLAGTISISVCQTILTNTLTSELSKKLPGFDPSAIANAGATQIRGLVGKGQLGLVLEAYNKGIDNTFYVALTASCLALVGSMGMEWRSVRARS